MSKNAALKREQKKVNFLSVEREQGRPLGQPTNDKIQSSRRFTDLFSTLSKNRSASDRCHCHFVHSFLLLFRLFVIELRLSAAKVIIIFHITKEKTIKNYPKDNKNDISIICRK